MHLKYAIQYKTALAPYGGQAFQVQRYAPIQERRELSKDEEREFEEEEKKWIPKIFSTDEDKLSVLASSPGKSAVLAALLGGGFGAVMGGAMGGSIGAAAREVRSKDPFARVPISGKGMAIGAGIGGVGLAALAALVMYHGKKAGNKNLREMARRLPRDARIRDMKADPTYQADMDRAAMLQAASIRAGRGLY